MATHAPSQIRIHIDPRLFSTSTLLGRSTTPAAQPAPSPMSHEEAQARVQAAEKRRFRNLAMGLAAVAYSITYLTLLAVTRPSTTADHSPITVDIPAAAEPNAIAAGAQPVRRSTPTLKQQPATARPSR